MTQAKFEVVKKKNKKLSVLQSIFSGSISGALEVLVDHPLWSIKTRMQKGEPFTLNLRVLYRGILPNAASMIPITAVQVGLNRLFQKWFFGAKEELSVEQRVASAFTAGVGSAAISCPTEMVMTHQKKAFYTTGAQLVRQGGWSYLYTGMMATMLREGMFSTFFLAVTPTLKSRINGYYPNEYVAIVLAGMLAGIGATLASQGFDVVKTAQQSTPSPKSVGFFRAAQKLYTSQGIYGFFKGTVPRGSRVMSAVTIMGWMNEKMNEFLSESQKKNEGDPTKRNAPYL